ncbi:esterase/lipase family protein [Pontiella sp.]|uniref:esterase/lipase family protein n=1 Tax=Pontiella sp. TaxID=2837462 RepID=UPI003563A36D
MKCPLSRAKAKKGGAVLALALMAGAQAASAQTVPDPTETVEVNKCMLYIYKADPGLTGLRHPVLFIEGFDFNNDHDEEALYTQFNGDRLIEELHDFGRDVILLNFDDANRNVWDNGAKTAKAIEYIQANRAGAAHKFTVVGAGMGGLTSRLALADLEAQNKQHGVDTWISFDAPHEGANIPLGLQKYLEFCASFTDYEPGFASQSELLQVLTLEALKEMLLVHYSTSDGLAAPAIDRKSLIRQLDAAGYPTNCKSIAISNGSGLGATQPFSPGEQIMHLENPALPWIEFNIYALPQSTGNGQNAGEQLVFDGLYYIVDGDNVENASYYPYALDNAPGSTSDLFYQLFSSFGYPDGSDYCTYSNYCVVSTTSSLGIPIEHIDADLSAHPEIRALSPFDEIHYGVANEPHMEINARNKAWFLRAVLEEVDSDGDGFDDYTEFLIGSDGNSSGSGLTLSTGMSAAPGNGNVALSCNLHPNTKYEVWFTEALGRPWTLLDTFMPEVYQQNTNCIYELTNAAGFFNVTAEAVDPVTD